MKSFLFFIGISSAIPTAVYMFILSTLLVLYLCPKSVQKGLTKVVYLLTIDETPVLSRVGTIAGTVAGALADFLYPFLYSAPVTISEFPKKYYNNIYCVPDTKATNGEQL